MIEHNNLEEAIQLISDGKKAAYLEALKVGTEFLEKESNPLLFLRREGLDYQAAAQRLVSYWEERQNAFGEKFVLPLTFTSYTEEATRALWDGVYLQLPNDSKGRTVVYRDNKKLATLSLKARLQLVFYLDRISNSNPRSAEEGIVLITTVERISFDRNTKVCTRIAHDSMSTRSHSLHILCSGCDCSEDAIALNLVRWYMKDGTYIHVCKTPQQRLAALLPFGLKSERLPEFLGGSARGIPWNSFAVGETNFGVGSYQSKQRGSTRADTDEPLYIPLKSDQANIIGIDQIEGISLASKEINLRAQKILQEAIDKMPYARKDAYQDALKHAPQLVVTESIPAWFLLYEKRNVQAAAQRLTSYWKERKRFFGDKAFLPLTNFTGEVPYNEEARQALREGLPRFLPNDSEGRTVVFFDVPRIHKLSFNTRIQILFYIKAMAMRNIESIRQGIVVLLAMNRISFEPNTIMTAHLRSRIMPVPVHSFHFLCNNSTLKIGIVPLSLPFLRWMTKQNAHFHECQTAEERAAKLLPFGITKAGLPAVLGGCLDAPQSSYGATAEGIAVPFANVEEGAIRISPCLVSSSGNSEGTDSDELFKIPTQIDRVRSNPLTPEEFEQNEFKLQQQLPVQIVCGEELLSFKFSAEETKSLPAPRALKRPHDVMESFSKEKEDSPAKPNKRQLQSVSVSDNDVLLGRGTKYSEHPGNLRLQTYIEKYSARYAEIQQRYKETSKSGDRRLLRQIKLEIYSSICEKGRFLKCDLEDQSTTSDGWYEVDSSTALKKIATTFRYKGNIKGIRQQVQTSLEPIAHVLENDVLLGKGTKYSRHPGNKRLQYFIEMHSDRYDEASKKHRNTHDNGACGTMNQIVREVFTSVSQTGRFLKYSESKCDSDDSPGSWHEVSGDISLKKIAMAFRNYRKRKQK